MPQLYNKKEVSVATISFKLVHLASMTVFILVFNALITYIARMESKLKRLVL